MRYAAGIAGRGIIGAPGGNTMKTRANVGCDSGRWFGRLLLAAAAIAALAACKTSDTQPDDGKPGAELKKTYLRSGYACCNLHYDGDWISDSNLAQLPFIAAGTLINVKKIDGYRAYVEVDGKAMRLGHDYGREQETTEQWVAKLVVLDDPKLRIAKFAPATREAIKAGKLMKGMSKEQVIMSVGHPQTNENPNLDGPYWRYWWSSFGPYYVYWSGAKVGRIDGHSETVGYMTYKGK